MFSEHDHMDFNDVKLATPLSSLKRAEKRNDILIVPESLITDIEMFLRRDKIKYHTIKNPALCPPEVVKSDMQRYIDIDGSFEADDPVMLITPFDKDSLFSWTLQLFGETRDPSFRAYYDSLQAYGEYYYHNLYEFRP